MKIDRKPYISDGVTHVGQDGGGLFLRFTGIEL